MSEAAEQANHLALEEVHRLYGANFHQYDSWNVPADYGDSSGEYNAIRGESAGVIDLSIRGRIRVSGSEALMFLNGLVTNDMKALQENSWLPAVFPNVQGRIIAAVRIVRQQDGFLIDTEATTRDSVLRNIDRFTLAGDFRVTDLSYATTMVSLQGKAVKHILEKVLGRSVDLPGHSAQVMEWREQSLTLLRATHTGEDGFDLIVPNENATALWDTLVEAGARPVGYDAWETLRIEAGIPRFKHDMDETNVVTETNLDDAISYTKGCYVGQEIVIRIKHRGHVAKKLTGLVFEKQETIEPGKQIYSEAGNEIGRITSATFSPVLNRSVALGYIRYEFLTAGTKVKVSSGDEKTAASVTDLPFVRGSWHSE